MQTYSEERLINTGKFESYRIKCEIHGEDLKEIHCRVLKVLNHREKVIRSKVMDGAESKKQPEILLTHKDLRKKIMTYLNIDTNNKSERSEEVKNMCKNYYGMDSIVNFKDNSKDLKECILKINALIASKRESLA